MPQPISITRWVCKYGHKHVSEKTAQRCEQARIPEAKQAEILNRVGFGGETITAVAKDFGVTPSALGSAFYRIVKANYPSFAMPDWRQIRNSGHSTRLECVRELLKNPNLLMSSWDG